MAEQQMIYGSLFEDDYLIRSLGGIVNQPETALTELVANAWDAGATEVKIFIPSEKNQAQNYSEDLLASFPNTRINAYVVGDSIGDNVQRITTVGNNEAGKVFVSTFSQLVDTAEKRLFGLRQKLAFMYDDVPGMDLYKQTLTQLNFK